MLPMPSPIHWSNIGFDTNSVSTNINGLAIFLLKFTTFVIDILTFDTWEIMFSAQLNSDVYTLKFCI